MPSRTILSALNSYAFLYQRFELIPVNWDKKTRKFVFKGHHRKLRTWYFFMFCMGLMIVSCLYIVLKEIILGNTLPLWQLFYFAMLGTIAFSGFSLGCGWLKYGEIGVAAWSNLIELEKTIRSGAHHLPPRGFSFWEELLPLLSFGAMVYTVPGSFLTVLFRLEPLWYVIEEIIPAEYIKLQSVRIVVFLFRFIVSTFACHVFMRNFVLIILILFAILPTGLHCIQIISHPETRIPLIFVVFSRFKVLYNSIAGFAEQLTAFGIASIFLVGVCANFGTIYLMGILPVPLNLGPPCLSIAVLLIIQLIVVPATDLYENQKTILQDIKVKHLEQQKLWGNRKYMIKRIKTLRPIAIGVGINDHQIFFLTRSSKVVLYEKLVYFSISGVLIFPM